MAKKGGYQIIDLQSLNPNVELTREEFEKIVQDFENYKKCGKPLLVCIDEEHNYYNAKIIHKTTEDYEIIELLDLQNNIIFSVSDEDYYPSISVENINKKLTFLKIEMSTSGGDDITGVMLVKIPYEIYDSILSEEFELTCANLSAKDMTNFISIDDPANEVGRGYATLTYSSSKYYISFEGQANKYELVNDLVSLSIID